MNSKKAAKRILRSETLDSQVDKEIEEAKAMRDIEQLEKKNAQLLLPTLFIVLILILFILFRDFETLNLSPRELINRVTSFQFSGLFLPAAILLLGFCIYVFFQSLKIREKRRAVFVQRIKLERTAGATEELQALFQASSAASSHKDPTAILETVGRESLNCLKAHRSTVFLVEEKSGILKTQFTRASDPGYEQVGLFEEKEVARKALRQRKPLLLRSPRDFGEFFKYEERDRKITSMISLPLVSQGKGVGVLSVTVVDEGPKFTERDLQFLTVLSQQATLAMENSYLLEEMKKGISFRKNYEQYLDHILNQLQSLSDVERRRIEDHIEKLLPSPTAEEGASLSGESEEVLVKGTMPPPPEQAADQVVGEVQGVKILQVDSGGESLTMVPDLGEGGVFIRTPNPMDLGEQFLLKLHLSEQEEPIELSCKVIWTNKYGKESRHLRRGMGVKFLNLTPELQRRVEKYIRSHKNRQFSLGEDQRRFPVED